MTRSLGIAVVDDDAGIRDILSEFLAHAGYTPHLFDGGTTTYQALHALHPAAIILDLRLRWPFSGVTLLAQMRADAALRHTPVILCSGDVRQLEELRPLADAPCAILPKPFDIHRLFALLEGLIDMPVTAAALSR